jgi:hypothetical protein
MPCVVQWEAAWLEVSLPGFWQSAILSLSQSHLSAHMAPWEGPICGPEIATFSAAKGPCVRYKLKEVVQEKGPAVTD